MLQIIEGDATDPRGGGAKIVAHVCNNRGGWGRGFVLALSKRWPQVESDYRAWYRSRDINDFALGAVRLVPVGERLWVANMIAQHGIRTGAVGAAPIRYPAVARCLGVVGDHAVRLGASVHMPRIGCGLAGGHWSRIEPILVEQLCRREVTVTVYDPPG